MRYFPVFQDLGNRPVLVIGGGEEALRKVRLLLKTEARIAVVAPHLHDELAAEARVHWIARHYHAGLLDGAALVFTAEPALNERVSSDAQAAGIPVNAVDRQDLSTFIVPSIVDRDPLVVAIGTEGTAPVLGQGLRARIDAMLPSRLGDLARAGAAHRARVAATLSPGGRRRSFWSRFFFGDVRDAFLAGDSCGYLAGVESLLADARQPLQGRVYFLSAPAHDADLLTLRAQRLLQEADVIVHDVAVAPAVLETARRDARRVAVPGKAFDGTDTILIREARAGLRVIRLSQTAPSIEETVAVAAEGVAIETVPPVSTAMQPDVPHFATNDDIRERLLRAAS